MEHLIVAGILAVAAFIAGRSFYRIMSGKNENCGCGGNCLGCASKNIEKADPKQDACR